MVVPKMIIFYTPYHFLEMYNFRQYFELEKSHFYRTYYEKYRAEHTQSYHMKKLVSHPF